MRKLSMFAMCLVIVLLFVGCRSTSIKTVTEFDVPTGAVTKITVTEESKTPFLNKWVNIFGWGYGFKIVLFDPQTGSYAPCIEAIGGRTGMNTMPVVGEDADTYCESLYIEKSMWSNAASVLEYNRVASGKLKDIKSAVKITLKLSPYDVSGTSLVTDVNGLTPTKITK